MKSAIYSVIIVPVLFALIHLVLTKFNKKKIPIPLLSTSISLIISFYLLYLYIHRNIICHECCSFEWISSWDINFVLSLKGISLIFLSLISIVFFLFTLLSVKTINHKYYWTAFLSIQAISSTLILSDNLITKTILFGLIWLPSFFLFSTRFSISWLASFSAILLSVLIVSAGYSGFEQIAFWLFIFGCITRLMDTRFLQDSKPELIILGVLLLPLVTIIFFVDTAHLLFHNNLVKYLEPVSYLVYSIAFVRLIDILRSGSIGRLGVYNILLYHSMLFIFLINPVNSFELIISILISKTIIDIIFVCCKSEAWLIVLNSLISFGLSGVIIGSPLMRLWSSWYTNYSILVLVMFSVFFIFFIFTAKHLSSVFKKENKATISLFKTIVVTILFIFIFLVSLKIEQVIKLEFLL